MKTKQETFDEVATFLLNQGGPAYDEEKDVCLYRGLNNTKCAAGCLIPDSEYKSYMDNIVFDKDTNEWNAITAANIEPVCSILSNLGYDPEFVYRLQYIHDVNSLMWSRWQYKMIEFAMDNGLSTKVFGMED